MTNSNERTSLPLPGGQPNRISVHQERNAFAAFETNLANCVSGHARLHSTNGAHFLPIGHVPPGSKNAQTKKDPKIRAKSLI